MKTSKYFGFLFIVLFVMSVCVEMAASQTGTGQGNLFSANNSSKIILVPGDEKWDDRFSYYGTEYPVWAVCATESVVYLGGSFTWAGGPPVWEGGVNMNGIAQWNGRTYSPLGTGLAGGFPGSSGSTPLAMMMVGSELYVGGSFTIAGGDTVNGIATWDGSDWSPVGSGADNVVQAFFLDGDYLYVGGHFQNICGIAANRIARLHVPTDIWEPLGPGIGTGPPSSHGEVRDILVSGGMVYVAGSFTNAGDSIVNNIARWDGTRWYSLDRGMSYPGAQQSVSALAMIDGQLYAGGDFILAGDVSVNSFARWDGSNWYPVDNGVRILGTNGSVRDLLADGTDLYLCGGFDSAGTATSNHIAKYNTVTGVWSGLGTGVNFGYSVLNLSKVNNNLFVGGYFVTMDTITAEYIARWDISSSSWHALGMGVNSRVKFIAIRPGTSEVYVGGQQSIVGGISANKVARFADSVWQPLRGGVLNFCNALTSTPTQLIAGGLINNADGLSVNNIASWNYGSQTWSAMGSGLSGGFGVLSLAAKGEEVFAGGEFTSSGASTARYFSRWNGTEWFGMGEPELYRYVKAIAVTDSFVYVGGQFTTIDGNPFNYIARWNGTNWETLGSGAANGTDYTVYSIATDGNDVYVGGQFYNAGGIPANRIAKWNSVTHEWSSLGSGLDYYGGGTVNAIAVGGGYVYAGGIFITAGGVSVSNIAKWHDSTSTWSAMGSGVNSDVDALAMGADGKLYVGGNFKVAGGKASYYFAVYDASIATGPNPPLPVSPANDSNCIALNTTLQWNASSGATTYQVQVSTDSTFATTIVDEDSIATTSLGVSGLMATTTYYWRVNGTNTNGTSAWSVTRRFTTGTGVLVAPLQLLPVDYAIGIPVSMTLSWERPCGVTSFILQVGYDTNYTLLLFNSGGITGTTYDLFELPTATWHYWRLRSVNGTDTSAWSPTWRFRTVGGTVSISVNVEDRWNLISVPVTVSDYRRIALFPSSTSSTFSYNSGAYVLAETLANRKGYWLKFGSTGSLNVTGLPRTNDTINVVAGWNLIGSISSSVAAASITSNPPGLITTNFYGYNRGYIVEDSIKPGRGYWVNTTTSGQLILSSGAMSASSKIQIVPSEEAPPPSPEGDGNSNNSIIPSEFALEQNYPNPFNPGTVISYQLKVKSAVTLKVYNMIGVEVATLVNELQDAGFKSVEWDASVFPSGVYLVRMNAGEFSDIKRIVLLK